MNNKINFLEVKRKIVEDKLNSLDEFARNLKGPLFNEENYSRLKILDFSFNMSISVAEKYGIDVKEYNDEYSRIIQIIEDKNEIHIRTACIKILDNYSERELRGKSVQKIRSYRILLIHDPRFL